MDKPRERFAIPQPCTDLDESLMGQALHVAEENGEVMQAFNKWRKAVEEEDSREEIDYRRMEIGKEAMDNIVCLVTLLDMMGFDEEDRETLCIETNVKNHKRGYWHIDKQ